MFLPSLFSPFGCSYRVLLLTFEQIPMQLCTDKDLFPMSSGVSEWVSERANEWSHRSKASSAERTNEWAVRVNERADERMARWSMHWFNSRSTQRAFIVLSQLDDYRKKKSGNNTTWRNMVFGYFRGQVAVPAMCIIIIIIIVYYCMYM